MLISFYRSLEDYEKQLAEIKILLTEALWQHKTGMIDISEHTFRQVVLEISIHETRIRTIKVADLLGFEPDVNL